jgi:hypothetical protein
MAREGAEGFVSVVKRGNRHEHYGPRDVLGQIDDKIELGKSRWTVLAIGVESASAANVRRSFLIGSAGVLMSNHTRIRCIDSDSRRNRSHLEPRTSPFEIKSEET